MRNIVFTHQYKKDLKLARKRNLPEAKLNEIYSKEDEGELHILNLLRTGTHSDLFKK